MHVLLLNGTANSERNALSGSQNQRRISHPFCTLIPTCVQEWNNMQQRIWTRFQLRCSLSSFTTKFFQLWSMTSRAGTRTGTTTWTAKFLWTDPTFPIMMTKSKPFCVHMVLPVLVHPPSIDGCSVLASDTNQDEKGYYVDGHERPATVQYRWKFFQRYLAYEQQMHQWIQVPATEANELEKRGEVTEGSGYKYTTDNGLAMVEYHCDTVKNLKPEWITTSLGGNLSVWIPPPPQIRNCLSFLVMMSASSNSSQLLISNGTAPTGKPTLFKRMMAKESWFLPSNLGSLALA